jgi:hypothetical protein
VTLVQGLAAIDQGMRLVGELTAVGGVVDVEALVDRLEAHARVAAAPVDLLDRLFAAASDGHSTELVFTGESWSLSVRADPGGSPSITESGESTDSLSDIDAAELSSAVIRNDVSTVVELAASSVPVEVTFVVANDASASGCHWVRSVANLHSLLTDARWVRTVNALAAGPGRLLVDDAGSGILRTDGLEIAGLEALISQTPSALQDRRVGAGAGNHHPGLPSPHLASRPRVVEPATNSFDPLTEDLHAVTQRLVWARLATALDLDVAGTVHVTLSGARVVQFDIEPTTRVQDADSDIDLYEWTFSADDIARYDSATHAATLAILSEDDLATAAVPVLRTARSLYSLAKSGAVAEALATRRAARQAVQDSAKQAAQTAREVAGKATERCLLQVGAAVAVVLTNAAHLIGDAKAYGLLIVVAVVSTLSLAVALVVELKSGRDALTDGLTDLDQHREALTAEDINAIKGSKAAKSARDDLNRSTIWTVVVYGLTIAAVLGVGAALIFANNPPAKPARAVPTSTTTSPP